MGKILKGLAAWVIALIVIVVIIVAAVGIYYGITLTSHHPTVTTTTTSTIPITNISVTTITAPGVTVSPSKTTIVLYTWWSTEGKIALDHLIPAFEEQYPQYLVATEIIPGGGGSNAVYAIMSLIKAGKPPDAFQTHYGPEMFSFLSEYPGGVKAGLNAFVNWTPYYEANLSGKVIPEVFEAGALNGYLASMPTQVHTASLLYINIKVLQHYGLPIPTNLSQLINDTLQLVKDGFYNSTNAPWGISGAEGGWGGSLLWENIFLALGGPRLYDEFAYGTLNLSDPHVMSIINETNQIFAELAKYNLPGWTSMTWTQMAEELATGHIAFFVMGDWATNYMYDYYNVTTYPALPQYLSNPNVTVVVEPFPGTQNYIDLIIDSIAVPTNLPPSLEKAAITFVEYWTSPQGQEIWTKWKGESYYLNMPTNYYNAPEQAWAYERLINESSNPSNWVYALSDGGLFVSPQLTIQSALLSFQEGVYNYAQLISAINQSLTVEKESWLTAAKYGLGYLGFPGHPFGNYYPPWVNSSSGDPQKVVSSNSMYKNDNANVKSSISNSLIMLPNLIIFTALALAPTILLAVSKRKIF